MGYVKPLPIIYLICKECDSPYVQHIKLQTHICPVCSCPRVRSCSFNKSKRAYDASNKGKSAFRKGVNVNDNPYKKNTIKRLYWEHGWYTAEGNL